MASFLIATFFVVAAWSVYEPRDWLTWFLETAPVIVIFIVLLLTYHRFPLTPLFYWLLWLGGILILIGAHYTYAEVPAFEWLKDTFDLKRNHYDRFGHFFQGVIPAIVFRDLLLQTSPLRLGTWLFIIVVALCLAKSALYEFAEWWTALIAREDANSFLAMQGDEWDAQQDMFLATCGSILSLLLFSSYHDKQLERLNQ